jgi:hypothetical protein
MHLWHAFVVFCAVICGSVGVHALMKKPPSFWRVVLVFLFRVLRILELVKLIILN